MKLHRLFTVCAMLVMLFYAAAPLAPVSAARAGFLQAAALQVTVTPDAANASGVVGFTITVENTSSGAAEDVVVEDQLDTAVDWQVDNEACRISGSGLLSCKLGSLPAGESVQVHVTSASTVASCSSVTNTARVFAANAAADDTGSVTMNLGCYPMMSIIKTAAAGEVNSGDDISFTLIIRNSGGTTADAVMLTDTLPAGPGLDWSIADPAPAECAIAAGVLTCDYGSLPKANTRTVTVTSPTTADSCGLVSNTAEVAASNEPLSQLGDNSATAQVTVVNCPTPTGPVLEIVKTADADLVRVPNPLGFEITVTNTGSATANNVIITDQLDPALTWSETTGAGCTISAEGLLTCTFASLAVGASQTVHVLATSTTAVCRDISNTATADADEVDPVDSDPAVITVTCPGVNVNVSKVAALASVNLGGTDPLRFTITARNTGEVVAQNVTLTDPLPGANIFNWQIDAPAPAGCAINGGTLTCAFGALNPGASASVTVSAPTVAGSCQLWNNTATVAATDEPTENLRDNTATASVTVVCPNPALQLTKTADASPVTVPAPIGFTLTLTNTGGAPAANVALTDQLASALAWTVTPGVAGCAIDAGKLLTCNFASLAAGASVSVHVTAPTTTAVCGQVSNTAYAQGDNLDQVVAGPVVVPTICSGVNIKVTKTAQKTYLYRGEAATFIMKVDNTGQQTATGVKLEDTLPANGGLAWSIVSPVPAGCAIASGKLTCNFGDLAGGASRIVQITSQTMAVDPVLIPNTAMVSATNETAGNQGDNTSTARVQIAAAACLNLNFFNGVYSNSFERSRPGDIGIENYRAAVAPKGQKFLGDYDNETVELTVACLPEHTRLLITFDLYILRSWDGNSRTAGPDLWKMELDGITKPLINTTFSNWSWSNQAYPDNYPGGDHPYLTGNVAVQELGYVYNGYHKDTIYRITMVVPHSALVATFKFTGYGLQARADESWGIDNILVTPTGQYSYFIPMIQP